MSDLNNVTKYIENKLSIERHKINLLNIYNRNNPYNLTNENIYNQRVLNNKKFSKLKVKFEENYYIDKQNKLLSKKISEINGRENVKF